MPEVIVLLGGVPASEYGHERYYGRREPACEQHVYDHLLGYAYGVAQGLDDGVVPIDGYEHEVEYRARAEVNVERVPNVAHEVTEQPLVRQLDARVEGHGEHRHEHVGQGERHHEVVRYYAELAVTYHRDYHQQVAEYRGHDYRAEYRAQQYSSESF